MWGFHVRQNEIFLSNSKGVLAKTYSQRESYWNLSKFRLNHTVVALQGSVREIFWQFCTKVLSNSGAASEPCAARLAPPALSLGSWHEAVLPVSPRAVITPSDSLFGTENPVLRARTPSEKALETQLDIETPEHS